LYPSGAFLSQTAGHGDYRPRFSVGRDKTNPDFGVGSLVSNGIICDGVDEVVAATREQLRRGATQIKVFASGGQLSEGDPLEAPQFNAHELLAIVETAA